MGDYGRESTRAENAVVFYIHVLLQVNDENDVDEIRGLMAEAARLSRQEPGCCRFEVYHSQSDPRTFVLTEWWETEDAWKAHRNERAFSEIYAPRVLPRVTRTPHISTLVE